MSGTRDERDPRRRRALRSSTLIRSSRPFSIATKLVFLFGEDGIPCTGYPAPSFAISRQGAKMTKEKKRWRVEPAELRRMASRAQEPERQRKLLALAEQFEEPDPNHEPASQSEDRR
jgi:hypothetical protein